MRDGVIDRDLTLMRVASEAYAALIAAPAAGGEAAPVVDLLEAARRRNDGRGE
jgi:hypothetical protein